MHPCCCVTGRDESWAGGGHATRSRPLSFGPHTTPRRPSRLVPSIPELTPDDPLSGFLSPLMELAPQRQPSVSAPPRASGGIKWQTVPISPYLLQSSAAAVEAVATVEAVTPSRRASSVQSVVMGRLIAKGEAAATDGGEGKEEGGRAVIAARRPTAPPVLLTREASGTPSPLSLTPRGSALTPVATVDTAAADTTADSESDGPPSPPPQPAARKGSLYDMRAEDAREVGRRVSQWADVVSLAQLSPQLPPRQSPASPRDAQAQQLAWEIRGLSDRIEALLTRADTPKSVTP